MPHDAPIALRPHQLRRAHLRLLVVAMDRAQDALDRRGVREAAERFFDRRFADEVTVADYLQDSEAHTQFYPWLLWDAPLGDGPLGGSLLARERARPGLDREVIDALLRAQADVFAVTAIREDGTELERVADGARICVDEPVLMAVAAPGEILVARVLELRDCALLDAVHACLPPGARRGMVRAARRVRGEPRDQRLTTLLRAARRAAQRLSRDEMPLEAPEGGPLVRATLVFDIDDPDALRARLERCATARLLEQRGRVWRVSEPGVGAVGATLRIRGSRLYATTASRVRAERLEHALPEMLDGLRYRAMLLHDLHHAVDMAMTDDIDEPLTRLLVDDWVEEVLARFHDTPQQSLGGITPREAVQTDLGKSRVRALLTQLGRLTDAAGTRRHDALDRIWQELSG